MYDRAKRNFDANLGSTPCAVGPGTYSPDTVDSKARNKAPFGSLAERKTLVITHGVIGPGAGYYKVPSQFEDISGGKIAFQNGPRLVDPRPVDDNPPPGAYFNMADWSAASKRKLPKKHLPIGVVFKPAIDPPSIPMQNQAYGYEYMGPANIKKQDPPKRDDTLGPAYYSPAKSTMNKKNAAKWSNRSEQRNIDHNPQFQLNRFTPGPQHYDTALDINENVVESPKQLQTAPRFVEKTPDAPPSTKYKLDRFGDQLNKNAISSSFVSTTDRFHMKMNGVPDPGAYNSKSELVTKKSFRKDGSDRKAPFTSSSSRFKSKKVTHRGAHLGPATYDVTSQSLAVQSIRDAVLKKTMKGGFGSNSERSLQLNAKSKTTEEQPGPGAYCISTAICNSRPSDSTFGTSSFTSMSNRVQNPMKAQESVPSPFEYNIKHHSIETNIAKENKTRHLNRAFNGTVPRTKAGSLQQKAGIDSPGPAAYTMPNPQQENVYISQGKRFVDTMNDAPHPQTYSLINDRFGSLEKTVRTFNATLGNATITNSKKKVNVPRPVASSSSRRALMIQSNC